MWFGPGSGIIKAALGKDISVMVYTRGDRAQGRADGNMMGKK